MALVMAHGVMWPACPGQPIGGEIKMPAGGGTVEVEATATSAWPIRRLEVVAGGNVVADTTSDAGAKRLHLKSTVRIDGSTWLAARCRGRLLL